MSGYTPELRRVEIVCCVVGGFVVLPDGKGGTTTLPERVVNAGVHGHDDALRDAANRRVWGLSMGRAANSINQRAKNTTDTTPWQKWARNRVTSLRIRAGYEASKQHKPYVRSARPKPTTWKAAAKRMYQQAESRRRYHARDPWQKWANTTAKNQNRRAEARRI